VLGVRLGKRCIRAIAIIGIAFAASYDVAAQTAARPRNLRIVIIEGEGVINVIQQKTAVAPIVEVRDQNDVPLAGVPLTFTIVGGKTATFAGAQTLTVATNAAGQATPTG